MGSEAPIYCVNHPQTETLLRCNKCGKPVCIKCVVRTPVGYRCKACLNLQQAGYYNATAVDYGIVFIVGTLASLIGGGIALMLSSFWWLVTIFYAPAAGSVIAEVIRWCIQKRRGKYIAVAACATVIIGALLVVSPLPSLRIIFAMLGAEDALPSAASAGIFGGLFSISLWIYIALAVSTVYARLRN